MRYINFHVTCVLLPFHGYYLGLAWHKRILWLHQHGKSSKAERVSYGKEYLIHIYSILSFTCIKKSKWHEYFVCGFQELVSGLHACRANAQEQSYSPAPNAHAIHLRSASSGRTKTQSNMIFTGATLIWRRGLFMVGSVILNKHLCMASLLFTTVIKFRAISRTAMREFVLPSRGKSKTNVTKLVLVGLISFSVKETFKRSFGRVRMMGTSHSVHGCSPWCWGHLKCKANSLGPVLSLHFLLILLKVI